MLPGLDGLSIVRSLRAADRTTPVLVLSALGEVDDRVEGLRAGGDDYLVKPFAFAELSARIEALARRRGDGDGTPATRLVVADLEMDLLARTVRRAGRAVELQPREFRLLEHLMRHAGQVVTRTMLLEAVWDYHFDPQTNVIDVHVSRLRRKIDRGFDAALIHTVRGAGLRDPGTVSASMHGGARPYRQMRNRPPAHPCRTRRVPRPLCLPGTMIAVTRSVAWRIAIGYGALFGLSMLALLVLVYWSAAGYMTRQMEAVVEAEVQGLAERYRGAGLRGLRDLGRRAAGAQPRQLVDLPPRRPRVPG